MRQTLRSILAQEDVHLSVVVVDDASTDDTAEVVGSMPGVQLIRHDRPMEQRVARNHGARVATTPWVAFCDDDDLWAPQKLRRQFDALADAGADWCTASALHVDEHLRPIGGQRLGDPGQIARQIRRRNLVPGGGSGVLVRRELFEHVGGFDESARFVEDWELWIRLSRQGAVACVDELLVAYRQWARSFSHDGFDAQHAAFEALTERAGGSDGTRGRARRASAFEVRQRLLTERRAVVARDLPRLVRKHPADTVPMLLMLGLPTPVLTELRLRRLGRQAVTGAERWLAPYRRTEVERQAQVP